MNSTRDVEGDSRGRREQSPGRSRALGRFTAAGAVLEERLLGQVLGNEGEDQRGIAGVLADQLLAVANQVVAIHPEEQHVLPTAQEGGEGRGDRRRDLEQGGPEQRARRDPADTSKDRGVRYVVRRGRTGEHTGTGEEGTPIDGAAAAGRVCARIGGLGLAPFVPGTGAGRSLIHLTPLLRRSYNHDGTRAVFFADWTHVRATVRSSSFHL